jgi:hypothetical protein
MYDNQQGIHDNIDTMTEKFEEEEEKFYHLCFPSSLLYIIPGLMMTQLHLVVQKGKLHIIVDPPNTISEEDTGNTNAQMTKLGVDLHCNPAVYYDKALLRHLPFIWLLRKWHTDRDILLYKDETNAAFRRIMYHLEIASTFINVLLHMLCIPICLIF